MSPSGVPPASTRVLIAGGGPVGLAAAVELGRRGIECVVIEPRRAVSRLRPRCKTVSVRTMEHLRRWGIAERLRQRAPLPVAWSQDVVFCTSLVGYELSLYDELGDGMSLVFDASRGADPRPLQAAARQAGVPFRPVAVGPTAADHFDAGMLLVRPDQHVAWVGDASPDDPVRVIDRVRGELTDVEIGFDMPIKEK